MYRAEKNENDIRYILENLRFEDKTECIATHGENYIQEIIDSINKNNSEVILGKEKGTDIPVLIGGIFPAGESKDIGVVWLLCTDRIKKHIICLLKEIKTELEKADKKYWFTCNYIWKENKAAKRWLKRYGYKFDYCPEQIKKPEGFEFFYRIRQIKGLGE